MAPLIQVILDSSHLYDYTVKLLFKLHSCECYTPLLVTLYHYRLHGLRTRLRFCVIWVKMQHQAVALFNPNFQIKVKMSPSQ